ncbi:MAG: hypothetical protein ABIU97_03980, partial [Dehalococcoidia bacterium]
PSAPKLVVLVDRSEQLSAQTIQEIVDRTIDQIRLALPNARVTIFAVTDSSTASLLPLYDGCRPKSSAEGNPVLEDVRRLDSRFKVVIDSISTELRRPVTGSRASPIAQAVTDLTLSSYLNGPVNQLLIFSDMLEHTSRFSMYQCPARAGVVTAFRASRMGSQERPTFHNTTVSLGIIPRNDLSANTMVCRDVLWPWFFGDMQGQTGGLEVRYLPGGSPR